MSLNELEKINYIKNNFHQYFDLELNVSLSTTETINLIIPIDLLTKSEIVASQYSHYKTYKNNYDIEEILNKYPDTQYEKKQKCFVLRVIDGDTIEVSIPYTEEGSNEVLYKKERVRLVGINTPELTPSPKTGADISKEFLEKALSLDSKIYLNIDEKKERDSYGRILAVVIVKNKNMNEILLKEELAEVWYIPPSEFYPFDWMGPNTQVHKDNFERTDINILSPYFNSEMTNIVFTPQNNYNQLYKFEVYKGVIYIRLNPFSQHIRMHLLPKAYDCSSNVLLFKDSMLTDDNISKSDDYYHYENGDYINAYYQINEEIRDRTNPDISSEKYNIKDWKNTFCEFSYDISKSTSSINNLEICGGYRYNNSSPFYSIHYTGVKDNTNTEIEDRCTLVDANYDKIENKTNNITQFHYDSNKVLYIPKASRDIKASYGDIDHTSQESIGNLFHKRIKYINDDMYSEEMYFDDTSLEYKRKYNKAYWVDLSK